MGEQCSPSLFMRLHKDDFVVATVDGKVFSARVLSVRSDTVQLVSLKDEHIPNLRYTFEVKVSDININLGQNPPPGKAYGSDFTKVYKGRKEHKRFGTLNFFYKPSKEVMSNLFAGFDASYKIMKRHGLEKMVEDDIIWEVYAYNKERYAGYYKAARTERETPRIAFKPESVPSSQYPYVILHELAHHLHYAYLKQNPMLEAKWISLFNTSIKVVNISKETSQEVLQILLGADVPPSKLRGELDDDLKLAYSWILKTIQQNHAVSVAELDVLLNAGMNDEVTKLWPRHTIKKKDLQPEISEYACKNYKETIAEAVSFYLTGRKLPKHVTKLVERTFAYVKTQLR